MFLQKISRSTAERFGLPLLYLHAGQSQRLNLSLFVQCEIKLLCLPFKREAFYIIYTFYFLLNPVLYRLAFTSPWIINSRVYYSWSWYRLINDKLLCIIPSLISSCHPRIFVFFEWRWGLQFFFFFFCVKYKVAKIINFLPL